MVSYYNRTGIGQRGQRGQSDNGKQRNNVPRHNGTRHAFWAKADHRSLLQGMGCEAWAICSKAQSENGPWDRLRSHDVTVRYTQYPHCIATFSSSLTHRCML